MSEMYDLEGIKAEWEKEISRYQTLVKAWESVTFPTKKDGTPFKEMSRNINGARYVHSNGDLSGYGMKLIITAQDKRNGYITDEIDAYEVTRYIKDDAKKAKFEKNLAPHEPLLKDLYIYDLDDIKDAIKKHVLYYKTEIETRSNDLKNLKSAYDGFKENYKNAIEQLEKMVSHYSASDIKDTIVKRYPYC